MRRAPITGIVLAVLLLLAGACGPAPPARSPLRLHLLALGAGEACLVTTACGQHHLIDSGSIDTAPVLLAYLAANGVTRLEHLVLTHPGADAAGGAFFLLQRLDVQTLLLPYYYQRHPNLALLAAAAAARSVATRALVAGDLLTLGSDTWLPVLHPLAPTGDADVDALLLGVTTPGFAALLARGPDLPQDYQAVDDLVRGRPTVFMKLGGDPPRLRRLDPFLDRLRPDQVVVTPPRDRSAGGVELVAESVAGAGFSLTTLEEGLFLVVSVDPNGTLDLVRGELNAAAVAATRSRLSPGWPPVAPPLLLHFLGPGVLAVRVEDTWHLVLAGGGATGVVERWDVDRLCTLVLADNSEETARAALSVLGQVSVARVLDPGVSGPGPQYRALQAELSARAGLVRAPLRTGVDVWEGGPAALVSLGPGPSAPGEPVRLGLALRYREFELVRPAGLTATELLAMGAGPVPDVLWVDHGPAPGLFGLAVGPGQSPLLLGSDGVHVWRAPAP